ncbi:MAG TPA: hypothetical protein VF458_01595 [Ktedonobacteraceae bacterium]
MDRTGRILMNRDFGQWVELFRRRAGLSQAELLARTDISRSTFNSWLGGTNPSRSSKDIDKLANALCDDIFPNVDLVLEVLYYTAGGPTKRSGQDIRKDLIPLLERIEGDISEQPLNVPRYFQTLDHYLTRFRFSKARIFTEDLIYYSEKYLSDMRRLLEAHHRVLLAGRPAAGKTVLALALAYQLQKEKHYKVFYLDISEEQVIDGQSLYQIIQTSDRKESLYILDNCHLVPAEISEFCTCWQEKPLKHAQCILVSRSPVKASDILSLEEEESEDYFDLWDNGDGVSIEVQPEELFHGILEKYIEVYQQQNPDRYMALEKNDESVLKEQHAHNLVISRIRLEVWREIGGRLSDLTQEKVYKSLSEKYLKDMKNRGTLLALCALWQYEIPVHEQFVKALPAHEVEFLRKEKLLSGTVVHRYGTLYELALHSIEAQEIFKADIYRREGNVDLNVVEDEIAQGLRDYLLTEPRNYSLVYYRLYRQRQISLLQRLLKERALQECARNRFEKGEIFEATQYLSSLSTVDLACARELLHLLVRISSESSRPSFISQVVLGTPFQIGQALHCIGKIDMQIAPELVAEIDIEQLVKRVQTSDFHLTSLMLNSLKDIAPSQAKLLLESIPASTLSAQIINSSSVASILILLQELEVSSVQEVIEALDIKHMVQHMQQINDLQGLNWMAFALKRIAPSQAKLLLESIPASTLSAQIINSSLPVASHTLALLQELEVSSGQEVIEALDIKYMVQHMQINNIQHLYWFLRSLRASSQGMIHRFLKVMTLKHLASLYVLKEANIKDTNHLLEFLPKNLRPQFLQSFSSQELAEMFGRSPLRYLGSFLQYYYYYIKQSYNLFCEQFLIAKFASSSLSEIGKFLHRIMQIPKEGKILRNEAFGLFVKNENFQDLFLESDLHDIQLFLGGLANIDTQYIQIIRQTLATSNIADKLAVANAKDIGYFLWNTYAFIDKELAQICGKLIDEQNRSDLLNDDTSLDDFCRFLWILAQISNLPKLQVVDNPALVKSLQAVWEEHIDLGMELLGLLAVNRPTIARDLQLPLRDEQKDQLRTRLVQLYEEQPPHPYILGLVLQGLRSYNELEAQAIVGISLDFAKVSSLFEHALSESVVTSRAALLLQETHAWLEKVLAPPNESLHRDQA